MRALPLVVAALLIAGCTTHSAVPCTTDGDCASYPGAVCEHTFCARVDMAAPPGSDMTALDGPAMCSDASLCGIAKPICGADQMCHPCVIGDDAKCASRDPKAPHCDASGECVACKVNADCPLAQPICQPDGSCRGCQSHPECGSGICNLDGSCAGANDVVYVDNVNGTCSSAVTHAGTSSDGYCDIDSAITNLGGRHYIHVAASSSAYPQVDVGGGSFSIVGPGGKSAKVSGVMNAAGITVHGTAQLTLDGLEVTGGLAGQAGVVCTGATPPPTLTLVRMLVDGVPGTGVNATSCKVILDRDQLGPGDAGGGLILSGSQFMITNSLIVGNASGSSPGVSFGAGSVPIPPAIVGFLHNTVAGNSLGVTSAGGISCAPAGTTIANSIVWGNSKSAGTQLSGACTLTYVDTDDAPPPSGTGNNNLPPDFVASGSNNYHLNGKTAGNLACCIDKIPSSPVNHDYAGQPRPQPVMGEWDIGADEVVQ
jgi:hypothetical protein